MSDDAAQHLADVWRREAPHVLAALLRRHGDLEACEDAAQEAFLAATEQWPREGVPDNPRGWLIRVGSRRVIDGVRRENARAAREERAAGLDLPAPTPATLADAVDTDRDDTLAMLVLCAHPGLTRASQIALTLRAVAGLTTEQVAAGFLVPTATIAQRISRAKASIVRSGSGLGDVTAAQVPGRMAAVLQVLHLMFTEAHTASGGHHLLDVSLADEAIRLVRHVNAVEPGHSETEGLLALMLLTHARRAARVDPAGELVPLAEQDRSQWDEVAVAEGVALLERALPRGPTGPMQIQGAIAACHAEARTYAATDWPQILALYDLLIGHDAGVPVRLARVVAVAMVSGAEAGLAALDDVPATRGPGSHRHDAVRAHLLELAGHREQAARAYAAAARLCTNTAEQRYLHRRARG